MLTYVHIQSPFAITASVASCSEISSCCICLQSWSSIWQRVVGDGEQQRMLQLSNSFWCDASAIAAIDWAMGYFDSMRTICGDRYWTVLSSSPALFATHMRHEMLPSSSHLHIQASKHAHTCLMLMDHCSCSSRLVCASQTTGYVMATWIYY